MFNKNYIIGGIAVVAVIGGIIWFSSYNGFSVPNTTAPEQGVKNLTREKAAEMIKTSFEINPLNGTLLGKAINADYEEKTGDYGLESAYIGALEKGGFITLSKDNNPSAVVQRFSFTEKAKPYVKAMEAGGLSGTFIILAEVVSVEVTGITEGGKTVRVADFTAKFKPTPIGVINDEKKAAEDVKAKAQFILYDDGWRVEGVTPW